MLTNGTTGVYFNDNTKILRNVDGVRIDYLERKTEDRTEALATFSTTDYPKELQKKVMLL